MAGRSTGRQRQQPHLKWIQAAQVFVFALFLLWIVHHFRHTARDPQHPGRGGLFRRVTRLRSVVELSRAKNHVWASDIQQKEQYGEFSKKDDSSGEAEHAARGGGIGGGIGREGGEGGDQGGDAGATEGLEGTGEEGTRDNGHSIVERVAVFTDEGKEEKLKVEKHSTLKDLVEAKSESGENLLGERGSVEEEGSEAGEGKGKEGAEEEAVQAEERLLVDVQGKGQDAGMVQQAVEDTVAVESGLDTQRGGGGGDEVAVDAEVGAIHVVEQDSLKSGRLAALARRKPAQGALAASEPTRTFLPSTPCLSRPAPPRNTAVLAFLILFLLAFPSQHAPTIGAVQRGWKCALGSFHSVTLCVHSFCAMRRSATTIAQQAGWYEGTVERT